MAETVALKNLEILRKSRNMSVDELMKMFGYDRSTYYQAWQKGKIKAKDIIELHNFFGVSTDCILDVKPIKIVG